MCVCVQDIKAADGYSDSDEDEHDAYLERMKEEGKIREEGESEGDSGKWPRRCVAFETHALLDKRVFSFMEFRANLSGLHQYFELAVAKSD